MILTIIRGADALQDDRVEHLRFPDDGCFRNPKRQIMRLEICLPRTTQRRVTANLPTSRLRSNAHREGGQADDKDANQEHAKDFSSQRRTLQIAECGVDDCGFGIADWEGTRAGFLNPQSSTPHSKIVLRRGWDSNPRYGSPYTAFPVLPIQPLLHLSELRTSERSPSL